MAPPRDRDVRRAASRRGNVRANPGGLTSPTGRLVNARRQERRRARRARLGWGSLVLLLAVAGLVASCTVAKSDGPSTSSSNAGTSARTTSSTAHTTTTTMPASFRIGLATYTWSEPGGTTTNPQTGGQTPGRTLKVDVWYPELAGGKGAARYGPFPVIVFAHGFEVVPATYASLLDAWVRAGFVVAAPVFPDENEATVEEDGGFTNQAIAANLEADERNEPGDIPFVLRQLQALDAAGSGSRLSRLLNLSKVALTGQSDGANVMAALEFDKAFAAKLAAMPVAARAVAVLSGQPLTTTDSYGARSSSPPVLFVQSNADTCNPPGTATTLYSEIAADPTKWFVELLGAEHLPPYRGALPWAPVVVKATTTFFELELGWRSAHLGPASVTSAGTLANVARVYTTTVPSIPNPGSIYCAPPPPIP